MLKTISINLSTTDPITVVEDSTIDEIGNSEIDEAKIGAKTTKFKSQNKSKGKNSVKSILVKSQVFTQGSGLCFLTPRARQAFTKLRQVFIKASILYYFYLDYYIWIETNESSYTIGRILIQLTLDNLS